MADPTILRPFILSWEGGFSNHPKDPGGATMKGITLETFRHFYGSSRTVEDLKNITDEQWLSIFRRGYWDVWMADRIHSQSIANLLVDWIWASGPAIIPKVQLLLGVKQDGVVGPVTLGALNTPDSVAMFQRIWNRRKTFIESCKGYNTFGNGWINRLNSIKTNVLVCNAYKKLNGQTVWKTIIFNDKAPHNPREEWLPKY